LPDGSGTPYAGKKELIFVGGNFFADQYLQDIRPLPQGKCGFPGCLDNIFNSARACYRAFSNDLASQTPNAVADVKYNGLHIVCSSNEDLRHVVTINPTDLLSTTYYWTENCNLQAQWVLNLLGSGDVVFTGDSFPANPGAVLIKFPGKNRRLTINNSVSGSILAPDNEIYQDNGVIIGKIVAGNVARVKQVNIVHCPTPDQIKLKVPSGMISPAGNIIFFYSVDSIRVGDTIENLPGAPGAVVTDVNFDENTATVDQPHDGISDVNFIFTVDVSDSRASRFIPPKATPSASATEETPESAAALITPVIAAFFAVIVAFF
jgi:choice-of-anchor A domain-containing protein